MSTAAYQERKWTSADVELVLTLSELLPRRPARRRRKQGEWKATGRVRRTSNGEYIYPPFRLSEDDYSYLVMLVNQVRRELKMDPLIVNLDPED